MAFHTRTLSDHLGLEILDLDLSNIDEPSFETIRALWQQHPLLLLRRQNPTDEEFLGFSRRFGKIDVVVGGSRPSIQNPELLYVSNLLSADGRPIGGLGNNELVWHTDQIYRENPASGSIFYGVEMPPGTGKTSFCNTAAAYDALPHRLKNRVDHLKSICRYGTKKPLSTLMRGQIDKTWRRSVTSQEELKVIEKRTPPVSHQMVLESKITGQKSLYFSPNHTESIEGLDKDQGQELIDELIENTIRDDFIYVHDWRNGDIILWDNARLLHRRDGFDNTLPRFAKRTSVFMDPNYFAVP